MTSDEVMEVHFVFENTDLTRLQTHLNVILYVDVNHSRELRRPPTVLVG